MELLHPGGAMGGLAVLAKPLAVAADEQDRGVVPAAVLAQPADRRVHGRAPLAVLAGRIVEDLEAGFDAALAPERRGAHEGGGVVAEPGGDLGDRTQPRGRREALPPGREGSRGGSAGRSTA